MPKAWQEELEERRRARPRVLSEEEQTWDEMTKVQELQDQTLKMFWHSEVPGSGAPECLMRAAVQDTETRGRDVSLAEALLQEGLQAYRQNDLGRLHAITARLLATLDRAPLDPTHSYWSFEQVRTWEQHERAVSFPQPAAVDLGEEFLRRVHAGWLAQVCGGALGTALEGYTAANLAEVFGQVTGYVRRPNTYNDDITFELAFLEAFAQRGRAVTSADVAEQWVALIPFGWSAEYFALQNLKLGIYPPESGERSNPYTEWIGAQMRGAVCGLVAPGDAREAARLAWVDGVISHSGNGVLGETFNAMLTALAFVRRDARALVEEVASLIPAQSQYRWVLDQSLAACKQSPDARTAWDRLEPLFERHNWIHAYPNAAAEVAALWFGAGDFDLTMRYIAMCGQDVDCNAAQVATVIGIMGGPEALASRWTEPIGDDLVTYVRGMERLSISGLARRTAEAARQYCTK